MCARVRQVCMSAAAFVFVHVCVSVHVCVNVSVCTCVSACELYEA
jgi:hypothetical protein